MSSFAHLESPALATTRVFPPTNSPMTAVAPQSNPSLRREAPERTRADNQTDMKTSEDQTRKQR